MNNFEQGPKPEQKPEEKSTQEWREHFGPMAEMQEKQEKSAEFVEKMRRGKEVKGWREHFGPLAGMQEQTEKELKIKRETADGLGKDIGGEQKEVRGKLSFLKKVEDKGLEKTIKITEKFSEFCDQKTGGKMFSALADRMTEWQNKTGFGWESEKAEKAADAENIFPP